MSYLGFIVVAALLLSVSLENTPGDDDLQEIYLEGNIKLIKLCCVYSGIF